MSFDDFRPKKSSNRCYIWSLKLKYVEEFVILSFLFWLLLLCLCFKISLSKYTIESQRRRDKIYSRLRLKSISSIFGYVKIIISLKLAYFSDSVCPTHNPINLTDVLENGVPDYIDQL